MQSRIWYFLSLLAATQQITAMCNTHIYCTAANAAFWPRLLNLIGSIHRTDFDQLGVIAVYDLGLHEWQKNFLLGIQKVSIYPVEKANPFILTEYFIGGRIVLGHFTWKPVVIKQALETFGCFLYLDAGTTVVASPNTLFKHIFESGYFLVGSGGQILSQRTTRYVQENLIRKRFPHFEKFLMSEKGFEISAGLQGITRSVYKNYVKPMYELACNDIRLFVDDNTASTGLGGARHDQSLFSIFAHAIGLKIHPLGIFDIKVNEKYETIGIDCNPDNLAKELIIRIQSGVDEKNISAIRYAKKLE